MAKRAKNISRRIKTSHKKAIIKRKIVNTHVDRNLADVNNFIDNYIENQNKLPKETQQAPKIDVETISFDDLKKLLDGSTSKKKRMAKVTVDDAYYLEALLKKWGINYERMAKDVKLNKMQWNAHQIQKKH